MERGAIVGMAEAEAAALSIISMSVHVCGCAVCHALCELRVGVAEISGVLHVFLK